MRGEKQRLKRQEKKRKLRRRRKRILAWCIVSVLLLAAVFLVIFIIWLTAGVLHKSSGVMALLREERAKAPEITECLLTPNEYSRPGTAIGRVRNIFIHYTANPGTDALQNRSYFEQLKDTQERAASAHFIIGYRGEIIQCIPLEEEAYAVKTRNHDSISIECCYLEEDGSFTEATYESLVELCAWLLGEYRLGPEDLLRHYDCGGKKCPLYYTEYEEAWEQLKEDVSSYKSTGNIEINNNCYI